MTVTYSADVATQSMKSVLKACFRWKGSVWKSVYKELIIWCLLYAIISVCYRLAMNERQQYVFEDICALCYKYANYVPVTFMLGFFVSQVVGRWSKQFEIMAFIDNHALYIQAYIPGSDNRSRMFRRNICRYLQLLQVMVFRDISPKFRRRFPTQQSVVAAGYITSEELEQLNSIKTLGSKQWVPCRWAMGLVQQAMREGKMVGGAVAVQDIFRRIIEFREKNFKQLLYDWVPLPLVYTQVVFVAVRFYFLIALVGRQYVISNRHKELRGPIDAYVPIFTIAQFIFYNGWLRVAEALLNPFGDDDDDFEVDWIVDRNTKAALDIVDEGECEYLPKLIKDQFWNEETPTALYSAETVDCVMNPQVGSATVTAPRLDERPVIMVPRPIMDSDNDETTTEERPNMARRFSRWARSSLSGYVGPWTDRHRTDRDEEFMKQQNNGNGGNVSQ